MSQMALNNQPAPIREYLQHQCDDDHQLLFMDGFDHCIIGLANLHEDGGVVAYDLDMVIQTLMEDGMTEEEALEFHAYNQAGTYVGETTPIFVKLTRKSWLESKLNAL